MHRHPAFGRWILLAGIATCCTALIGCGAGADSTPATAPKNAPWFQEITTSAKIDFLHNAGLTGSYFMPQSMGSGAALFDFDQDGRLDIYLIQGAGPGSGAKNQLYRQQTDGTFLDVSRGSGLDVAGFGSGVAIGDANNDGLPDVVVTEYGAIRLFVNEGDGKFLDVSRAGGIQSLLWATSASFLDFDRDGWLDLIVVNYVDYNPNQPCYGRRASQRDFCSPLEFSGTHTLLFHNITSQAGVEPRFEDVSNASGVGKLPGPGLGVLCADFNDDGWDDIFVANDQEPNRLWINQHDGTFRDEALARGVALDRLGKAGASMGVAWGDIDGDRLDDLFVTKLDFETHTLWKQGPRGLFLDRSPEAGLADVPRTTGFGTAFGDLDLDGDLDLAYVSGRVFAGEPAQNETLPEFWRSYAESNELLENDGRGRFASIAARNADFCGRSEVSRGLCYGDVDNDGDVDLLVTTTAGPARLFKNVVPQKGHWLVVRVLDPALKRDAYGAVVTVAAGDRTWQRLINPGTSYQSSNDSRAHFGLGGADRFDSIQVRWPDGTKEQFPGGASDRHLVLRKGEGAAP